MMARGIKTRAVKTISVSEGYKAPKAVELNPDNFHDGIDFVMAFSRARRDGKLPFTRIRLSENEEDFLRLVTRGGLVPVFKGKGSNNIFFKKPEDISEGDFSKQFSDSYFMPVLFRSTELSRSSSVKYKDSNDNEIKKEISFMSTAKKNIKAINEVMLDIDIRQNIDGEEVPYDEGMYERISKSVLYFACEDNLPLPTAIVSTGRGLQLHFVAKNPIYLNSKSAENLIDFTRDKLKDAYNKVLANISVEGSGLIKCDDATGSFSQKMRLPGSINTKSGTRAKLVYFNSNATYVFSDILDELVGEKEGKAKISARKSKIPSNKRMSTKQAIAFSQNIIDTQRKRMNDISEALLIMAKEGNEVGYRNNAYWAMATVGAMANLSYDEIRKALLDTDAKLGNPYFTSEKKVRGMIKYAQNQSPGKLSNKSIEEEVLCVREAIAEGHEFSTLGTVIREDIRKETKSRDMSSKVELIGDLIEGKRSVSELEARHPFKKSAIYVFKKIVDSIGKVKKYSEAVASKVIRACKKIGIKKVDEWVAIVREALGASEGGVPTKPRKSNADRGKESFRLVKGWNSSTVKDALLEAGNLAANVAVNLTRLLTSPQSPQPALAFAQADGRYNDIIEFNDLPPARPNSRLLQCMWSDNDDSIDKEEDIFVEDLFDATGRDKLAGNEFPDDFESREELIVDLLEDLDGNKDEVMGVLGSLMNPTRAKEIDWGTKEEDPILDMTGVIDLEDYNPDLTKKI